MPSLSVGAIVVKLTTGARNLGVLFDDRLNLKQHISNMCCACYFQRRQLCVVRRSLSPDFLLVAARFRSLPVGLL